MSQPKTRGPVGEQRTREIVSSEKRWERVITLTLIGLIGAVFWQVHAHQFLNYDDNRYLTDNPQVQAGLTYDGVIWAFATAHFNWHPLTWLSHMLDCELFGLHAGAHHLVNVLLHTINTLLLLVVLRRMTGALWQSAFVAALFAIHPLHVESVAWIAERKDVLSRMFWMLTMLAYFQYARRPSAAKMFWVGLSLALGLMCKQMLVTLPFLLLLLDFWPLGRFTAWRQKQIVDRTQLATASASLSRLVSEKIPLFIIVAVASVAAILAQRHVDTVVALQELPLWPRLENATVAYVLYLGKILWPHNLAVPYPHPGSSLPGWQVAAAALVLLAVSASVVFAARRRPYLTMGWLWFLGTLVPVIGLVQIGPQAMADRYAYGPAIGIFIMVAWGVPGLTGSNGWRRIALGVSAALAIAILSACAWMQTGYWRNSVSLFTHTLQVTDNNSWAHYFLAEALAARGDFADAVPQYRASIRINPHYPDAQQGLGATLGKLGDREEALQSLREAVRLAPEHSRAQCNLGTILVQLGQLDAAITHYETALRLQPDYPRAHQGLGVALEKLGDREGALRHLTEAVRLAPENPRAHRDLGTVLGRQGEVAAAAEHYGTALRLQPDDPLAHRGLAVALEMLGDQEGALQHLREAARLEREDPPAARQSEQYPTK